MDSLLKINNPEPLKINKIIKIKALIKLKHCIKYFREKNDDEFVENLIIDEMLEVEDGKK